MTSGVFTLRGLTVKHLGTSRFAYANRNGLSGASVRPSAGTAEFISGGYALHNLRAPTIPGAKRIDLCLSVLVYISC